jgi:Tfp pilus assembly protein PilV
MLRIAHEENGMGLVELLVATVVTSIGIFALVAGFSSGRVALQRASTSSQASVLADEQMEAFRAARWDAVGLDPAIPDPAIPHYTTDAAYTSAQIRVKKAETTTTADIDDLGTTLSVASFAGFPATGEYYVVLQPSKTDQAGAEIMRVTSGNGTTTWTVARTSTPGTLDEHPAGSYVATVEYVTDLGCGGSAYCQPSRVQGAYRIDTYVRWTCPIGGTAAAGGTVNAPTCPPSGTTKLRPAKLVTIVVREAANPAKVLVRESSTFDESTG